MKVSVMQPYFFPYVGYYQLIEKSDAFVIFDDAQFTRRGWIHRNRILQEGENSSFTLPVHSPYQRSKINECTLKIDNQWRRKFLERLRHCYHGAEYFDSGFKFLQSIVSYEDSSLARFLDFSLVQTLALLEIETPTLHSSDILCSEDGKYKVPEICQALGANEYLNPDGGMHLYIPLKEHFGTTQLVSFHSEVQPYAQIIAPHFEPSLSLIDLLMHLPQPAIKQQVMSGHCYNKITLNERHGHSKSTQTAL